jgi:hypothetical protein
VTIALEPFLQRFAEAGLDGDIDRLATMVSFPYIVYAEARPHVFPDPQDLARRADACSLALRRAGVHAVEVTVTARRATRGPRHTAWTETVYLDRNRRPIGTSTAQVYVGLDRQGPRIEMIELGKAAIADALHALCAPARRARRRSLPGQ